MPIDETFISILVWINRCFLLKIINIFLKRLIFILFEQLKDFKSVYPPKLVLSTKWKHDYIIYSESFNG